MGCVPVKVYAGSEVSGVSPGLPQESAGEEAAGSQATKSARLMMQGGGEGQTGDLITREVLASC